jgi:protein phosphatase PTC7
MVVMFTDGLSDNVPVEHLSILYNSVNQLLELPENNHLSPQDKDAERARIMADVLVAYGRMAMTRTGEEEDGRHLSSSRQRRMAMTLKVEK